MSTQKRELLGKIFIGGEIKCLTGLHIGATKENMEIGALDSPVVRDPISREPFVPGSSLKGKMRCLLEKSTKGILPNREGGTSNNSVKRHECDSDSSAKICPVCRLFGSTKGKGNGDNNFPARLKVRDCSLTNIADLQKIDTGLYLTEWKFENALDRVTSAANPRNIERVPRGAKFKMEMVYDVDDMDSLGPDLENLRLALRLLEDDALGGHGSRGYGQVGITISSVECRTMDYYAGRDETSKKTWESLIEAAQQAGEFLKEKLSEKGDE